MQTQLEHLVTMSQFLIIKSLMDARPAMLYMNIEITPGIDAIEIPLRLVVTDNEEVKSRITVSTNNQTAIKREQLSAMSDFQKNLEHYYTTIDGDGKLYYERRAKQYNSDRDVVKRRIITVIRRYEVFLLNVRQEPSPRDELLWFYSQKDWRLRFFYF